MTLLSLRDLLMTSLVLEEDMLTSDPLRLRAVLTLLLAAAMEMDSTDCLRSENTERLMIIQIENRQATIMFLICSFVPVSNLEQVTVLRTSES